MPTIDAQSASNNFCPYNGFKPCYGMKCMAWVWVGPTQERAATTNLVNTPDGPRPDLERTPPMPAGDGWERHGEPRAVGYEKSSKLNLPKALEQAWVRKIKVTHGRCGRTHGDECSPYADMPF
ncbi:MAG: hypothetical protein ACOYLQ_15360 [Hyphomicrobiaceae bacterium]